MLDDDSVQKTKEKLQQLLDQFDGLARRDLRNKVIEIIPMWEQLKKLGCELIPKEIASSARNRVLHYFISYPKTIISYKEIQIIPLRLMAFDFKCVLDFHGQTGNAY